MISVTLFEAVFKPSTRSGLRNHLSRNAFALTAPDCVERDQDHAMNKSGINYIF